MGLNGLTNGGPFDVAKHVDQIKARGDHGLKSTDGDEFFHQAAPVGEGLSGTREAHAPLMHAQKSGAQLRPVRVHNAFGVAGTEEFTHFDGSRLVVFFALPAESGAREPARLVAESSFVYGVVQLRESTQQAVGVAPARH